ncbi:MAG: hypothetical protein AB1938_11260 [Myxococcota bacterium]
MSRFLKLLVWWPTEKALRVSAVLGLIALALMCLGVLDPRPLQVVISMSVSQIFGGVAFIGFFLSVAADVAQARARIQKLEGSGGAAGTSAGGSGAP